MSRLRGEYIYTHTGPQRPVFLCPGAEVVRYVLDVGQGGEAVVQVTYDPPEMVKQGRVTWVTHDAGEGGGVYGVTGIRALVKRVDGWVTLTVEQDDKDINVNRGE